MTELIAYLNTNGPAITTLATVILTITTIIYAWLTGILAIENRRLRKAGTEPQLIAYLFPDARHVNILYMVIANVGRGPAKDVSLEYEADVDDFRKHHIEHQPNVRRTVLAFLPQDEKLFHYFGNAIEMFDGGPPRDFLVHLKYCDLNGNSYNGCFRASVADLEGFRRVGEPPEYMAAEALKSIKEEISKWGSGFSRLKVETITAAEQQQRNSEAHARYKIENGPKTAD